MLQNLLNGLRELIFQKDKILVVEMSDYLVQRVKSSVRKNRPYCETIKNLKSIIANEFGIAIMPKQLVQLINATRLELQKSGIDLFADDKDIIANRPISSAMLEA